MKEIPIIQDHLKNEPAPGKIVIKESIFEWMNNIFKERRESFDLECYVKMETDGTCNIVSFSIRPKRAVKDIWGVVPLDKVLGLATLESLAGLADGWAEQWKIYAETVEILAKNKRFGEAEAFNSKATIYLECAERLRKELQSEKNVNNDEKIKKLETTLDKILENGCRESRADGDISCFYCGAMYDCGEAHDEDCPYMTAMQLREND